MIHTVNVDSSADKPFSPSIYLRGINTPYCAMYLVDKPSFVIGKDDNCDAIAYFSNEISHQHARIDWCNDHWTITDLNSTNGTYLNGRRLTPNKGYPLHIGDRFKLSSFSFAVERINRGEQ